MPLSKSSNQCSPFNILSLSQNPKFKWTCWVTSSQKQARLATQS